MGGLASAAFLAPGCHGPEEPVVDGFYHLFIGKDFRSWMLQGSSYWFGLHSPTEVSLAPILCQVYGLGQIITLLWASASSPVV